MSSSLSLSLRFGEWLSSCEWECPYEAVDDVMMVLHSARFSDFLVSILAMCDSNIWTVTFDESLRTIAS